MELLLLYDGRQVFQAIAHIPFTRTRISTYTTPIFIFFVKRFGKMDFTTEDIPLIFASVLAAYSLYRLIVVFFKKGKQSPFNYWSRFLFRFFFFVHSIFGIITNVRQLVTLGTLFILSPYIAQILLDIALCFLVISLQDFVCYSNRDPTFIKRNWIFLTLPFLSSLVSSQLINYFSSSYFDQEGTQISKLTYEILFLVFILSLIDLPVLFFMNELSNNDFSGSMANKILCVRTFFIFQILCLIASSIWEMSTDYTVYNRKIFLIFKSARDPIVMMICFSQDMIDWMLKWLYLEEDEINIEDEAESQRKSPGNIELIGVDI